MKRLTLSFMLLFSLTACHTNQSRQLEPVAEPIVREQASYLTQDIAKQRKQQIQHASYSLELTLDRNQESFSGKTTISTEILHNLHPLSIDFVGGSVDTVTINGSTVPYDYQGNFIELRNITPGKAEIVVHYQHPYSQDGSGLHKFVDPEDQLTYLYTDFEPYDANRLFPHFDQPNIKANYQLTVQAPSSWTVITSVMEENIERLDGFSVWHFPTSDVFSSYVFSLHAGPYFVWEDNNYRIPLRLFSRQSLAQYVVEDDWLTFTRQGFDFFEEYFDVPYPFKKYDQIIVPEFNAGAMENVAAVTFTERLVKRAEKLPVERLQLANVVLHEMAHMWFGDLVTMDWWNGLWLNESFATYMAYLALVEATEFDYGWHRFYTSTKQWAYRTDQQVTTHPIELPVKSTDDAFTNFDGITYGKGASILKQLPEYIGREAFRKGVSQYLKEHQYANTELSDFIKALEQASATRLDSWTQQWLYQAGLNTIRVDYSCNDAGYIEKLDILQKAPEDHPTLREQRVQVAFYNIEKDSLTLTKVLPIIYKGEKTSIKNNEEISCPDLVYPNYQDWGFVKVALDDKSLDTVASHVNMLDDAFLRSMLWQNLWDMVEDTELSLIRFLDLAQTGLKEETNPTMIRSLIGSVMQGIRYLRKFPDRHLELGTFSAIYEELFWNRMLKAKNKNDKTRWFDAYVSVMSSSKAINTAKQLLSGKRTIKDLDIDQDRRWRLILTISRQEPISGTQLAKTEKKRDTSDLGKKNAIMAEAIKPNKEIKAFWLNEIIKEEKTYSLADLRGAMAVLFPSDQSQLQTPFAEKIISALPELNKRADQQFLQAYTRFLLPGTCNTQSIERLSNAAKAYTNLNPIITKALLIAHQNDERCNNIAKNL